MRRQIIQNGESVGFVSDDPEYHYSYDGSSALVEDILESAEEATDVDSGYGPGDLAEERVVDGDDAFKAQRAIDAVESRPDHELREDDADVAEKAAAFLDSLIRR